MIQMTIPQHKRNIDRIGRFLDNARALGVDVSNPEMLNDLLMMTLQDETYEVEKIRAYLDKWSVLNKWDEYQATNRIMDILDYRLR